MTTEQLIVSAGDAPETSVRRDQIEAILRLRAYKANMTAASDRRVTAEVERATAATLAESARATARATVWLAVLTAVLSVTTIVATVVNIIKR
jgi:hypothetical protein